MELLKYICNVQDSVGCQRTCFLPRLRPLLASAEPHGQTSVQYINKRDNINDLEFEPKL